MFQLCCDVINSVVKNAPSSVRKCPNILQIPYVVLYIVRIKVITLRQIIIVRPMREEVYLCWTFFFLQLWTAVGCLWDRASQSEKKKTSHTCVCNKNGSSVTQRFGFKIFHRVVNNA